MPVLFFLLLILLNSRNILAQTPTSTITPILDPTSIPTSTPTPTPTPDTSGQQVDLQNQISDLKKKLSDTQSQGKTLSSQISVMNNQIRLTELRVKSTQEDLLGLAADINAANKKIATLQSSLDNLTKVLINRIAATYKTGRISPLYVLMSSQDATDLFSKASYLKIVQAHDQTLIYETQQAKNDYGNQKEIFEAKKKKVEALSKQLQAYNAQLDQEKTSKQQLLEITQNDEKRYQKLLAEAEAQIQAFKSFSASKGGSSILPAQPSPDGWYYNQRDERWGRNSIGSSSDQIWDVGCLVASTAMVLKKHGQDVTPATIAGISSYFFSNTAYMLLPWNGGKFTSIWGFNQGSIDSKLSSGEPVLVGLRAGVYGMHFVVLKSGSNGDYIMNDPWNGPDLKFSDFYSTSQIFQYGYYNG